MTDAQPNEPTATESPILAALDAPVRPPPSNLPAPLTPLVGRKRECAALAALLLRPGVRLVTLTGPGGVGKTRLALTVAADLAARFADGVRFVDLTPLTDPTLVGPAIATSLGLADGAASPGAALRAALRDRHLLLVLDNFERVVPAGTLVVDLLASCPRLTILATSRAVLQVSAEHDVPVPPLSLSRGVEESRSRGAENALLDSSTSRLLDSEAVELFVSRAEAGRPGFAPTAANAAAVAEICRRLDGLPLAIELAAARLRVMSPDALLYRLESRLPLLTGGARDLPDRQRTMRDAIAWSHDLLAADAQALFRRLAVFAGGFTIDAAEAVSRETRDERRENDGPTLDPRLSTLDSLSGLVDQSLVRQEDGAAGEPRFGMLETIQEYGLERLAASGEEPAIRAAHAAWCLGFAEESLHFPDLGWTHAEVLDRIEAELGHLRQALGWLDANGDAGGFIRLALAMTTYWLQRSHRREGRRALERALALAQRVAVTDAVRTRLHFATAALARTHDDYPRASELGETALAGFRRLGDRHGAASALNLLGALARGEGDYERAADLTTEALAIFEALAEPALIAIARCNLGIVAFWRGDAAAAVPLLEAALAGYRALGDLFGTGFTLQALAVVIGEGGDRVRAAGLYRESLACALSVGAKESALDALAGLATVAVGRDQAEAAARLLGAVEAQCEPLGYAFEVPERRRYARATDETRTRLGEAAFAAAWAAGRALTPEAAVAEADATAAAIIAGATAAPPHPERGAAGASLMGLTEREMEVLRLLVEGHTDRTVAERLAISPRTAMRHSANIYLKLGVHSRAAAVSYALRQALV